MEFHSFPASGQFSYTQTFFSSQTPDQNNKPAKLLVTFDLPKYRYNYRIDLTCTK